MIAPARPQRKIIQAGGLNLYGTECPALLTMTPYRDPRASSGPDERRSSARICRPAEGNVMPNLLGMLGVLPSMPHQKRLLL